MPPSEKVVPPDQESPVKVVGAIPARFGSTRLPGKALLPLAGRPMIQHVYERACRATSLTRVVILTDDERIMKAAETFAADCEFTPASCASGTDRVAHAAKGWDTEAVINIQGDEPLIDPAAIDRLATHFIENPDEAMATLAAPAESGVESDPNVVKVVRDLAGRALYFSRAKIPHVRGEVSQRPWLQHIGIYGYRRETLLKLASLAPTSLEESEALEQLRALEHGIPIRVLTVDQAWPGVDTMEDLERVTAILSGKRSATRPD